jgi:hypothetical protein
MVKGWNRSNEMSGQRLLSHSGLLFLKDVGITCTTLSPLNIKQFCTVSSSRTSKNISLQTAEHRICSSSEFRSQTTRINSEETASCSTEMITAYVATVAEI